MKRSYKKAKQQNKIKNNLFFQNFPFFQNFRYCSFPLEWQIQQIQRICPTFRDFIHSDHASGITSHHCIVQADSVIFMTFLSISMILVLFRRCHFDESHDFYDFLAVTGAGRRWLRCLTMPDKSPWSHSRISEKLYTEVKENCILYTTVNTSIFLKDFLKDLLRGYCVQKFIRPVEIWKSQNPRS